MKKTAIFIVLLFFAFSSYAQEDADVKRAYYRMAATNNNHLLQQMQSVGYFIDSIDERGNTALCEAVLRSDSLAIKNLRLLGANPNVSCMEKIPLHYRQMHGIVPAMYSGSYGSSIAFKQNTSPYMAVRLGVSSVKSDLVSSWKGQEKSKGLKDTTYSPMLAFGMTYKLLRAEIEAQYSIRSKDKINDLELSHWSAGLMTNLYLDIPLSETFYPYIMAGAGISFNNAELKYGSQKQDNHRWNFAWSVGAGFTYKINKKLFTDIGYRYTDYGKINILQENEVDYTLDKIRSHALTLGLRYHL